MKPKYVTKYLLKGKESGTCIVWKTRTNKIIPNITKDNKHKLIILIPQTLIKAKQNHLTNKERQRNEEACLLLSPSMLSFQHPSYSQSKSAYN